MNRKARLIATGAAAAATAIAGAVGVVAVATADDQTVVDGNTDEDGAEENDVPITGPDLERAKEAALVHLGEGTVTATEIEDEESYYEVEVRLPNGQVDVQLDEEFNVLSVDGD